MRIFKNLTDALGEIARDLREMGIRVHSKTYQDVDIANNPDFEAYEVQNYTYLVTDINPRDPGLRPTQPWVTNELVERLSGHPLNPGEAYKLRRNVWDQFLRAGKFAYTYAERIARVEKHRELKEVYHRLPSQVDLIVDLLKKDPASRQAFMSIWNPDIDLERAGGEARIPCSLGYYFQIRQGRLNMTYLQRSADFSTHFHNDIWLAINLQDAIAQRLEVPLGYFCHWLGSLHVFSKDVRDVF